MCASGEKDKISKQCSDDEGCLYTNLRELGWNFQYLQLEQIRLRITQLECECLKIKCMLVEFDQQARYEFGVLHNSVNADTASVFGFGQFKGYLTLNFWNPVGRIVCSRQLLPV